MAAKTKQWVIAKGGLYANVTGAFGGKPKVYDTMRAAQYDLAHNPGLKGGIVRAHTGAEEAKTPGFATTTKAKVGVVPPSRPRRAAAGMAAPPRPAAPRGKRTAQPVSPPPGPGSPVPPAPPASPQVKPKAKAKGKPKVKPATASK
jgi:hypothetical protein